MASVRGAEYVGLRICPGFAFNDVKDPNPQETFEGLLSAIRHLPLAYLHLMRASTIDVLALGRDFFDGALLLNGGYDGDSAADAVSGGEVTAVSFATHYIANPDLVERLRNKLPLAQANPDLMYTPTVEGYADYPAYSQDQ